MGQIKGKVLKTSPPKLWGEHLQIGFVLVDYPTIWYNISGSNDELQSYLTKELKIGNKIQFNLEGNSVTELKVLVEAKETPTQNSGKFEDDKINFEVLLTKAHAMKQPFSIKTECLKIDLEKKYALFKAQVVISKPSLSQNSEDGYIIFEGHGDATNDNIKGEFIKPHFIRMAETRAICRALRWYTNNGCAEEEK